MLPVQLRQIFPCGHEIGSEMAGRMKALRRTRTLSEERCRRQGGRKMMKHGKVGDGGLWIWETDEAKVSSG